MKLDAFKAIDAIEEADGYTQTAKDAAIAYILDIIRLMYDKKARDEYEKLILDNIK